MIRVVLDANQFVSVVLNDSGIPAKVFNAWRNGYFQLVISPPIIDEIRRVLNYPRLSRIHKKTSKEIDLFLQNLVTLAFNTPNLMQLRVVQNDPTDDKYLVAALEGQAGFIVTGDTDLLEIEEFEGIRILTPREFLNELKGMRSG